MPRTIISLSDEDKRWLDEHAAREGVAMTEVVRRALRDYRLRHAAQAPTLEALLAATRGCWQHGDALGYQRRAREEWDGRR